ncbi:MAG TPA: hypothetical protein VFA24_05480 [Gaiellaceae bacterium]|nr:hypothetical protein [Gaiellaceae bacterium]
MEIVPLALVAAGLAFAASARLKSLGPFRHSTGKTAYAVPLAATCAGVALAALVLGAATQTGDDCVTSTGLDIAVYVSAAIAPTILIAAGFGVAAVVVSVKRRILFPLLALPLAILAAVADLVAFGESFQLCLNFM